MSEFKYVYGPIPSRRLGSSLGISPIPKKACNYACVYCQLGITNLMTNTRQLFYPVEEILSECEAVFDLKTPLDVVTIVGEGEPALYLGLGALITGLKRITDKPIAVITNGALLSEPSLREELMNADIVLPSLDGHDEASFKKINRPHKALNYETVLRGLIDFAHEFRNKLWLEIMIVKGMNDSDKAIEAFKSLLTKIPHDKLYLNSPVRPPAKQGIGEADHKRMELIAQELGGIAIDYLSESAFHSDNKDDFEAILTLIRRHPMNQHELKAFLAGRQNANFTEIIAKLEECQSVEAIDYKGYRTYRLK